MFSSETLRRRLAEALASGDADGIRAAAEALTSHLEQIEAPERWRHTDRLARLGLHAAELVHELRQPLLAIKGYAQLILERPADTAFVDATAHTLVEQSVRMEEVLERVRAYGRPEPPPEENGAQCDVNSAVNSAVALLAHQLRKHHINVVMELGEGLPNVSVSCIAVQQVIVNLLANARDALADREGTLRIATRRVGDAVEAVVADDGAGVAAEIRERLFTEFATDKRDGTGLGLAVSRHIAVEAGGSLELVDAPVGATFRLLLPVLA